MGGGTKKVYINKALVLLNFQYIVIMTTINLNTHSAMSVKMYCNHHTSALHIYLRRHTEHLVWQHKVKATYAMQTLKATWLKSWMCTKAENGYYCKFHNICNCKWAQGQAPEVKTWNHESPCTHIIFVAVQWLIVRPPKNSNSLYQKALFAL